MRSQRIEEVVGGAGVEECDKAVAVDNHRHLHRLDCADARDGMDGHHRLIAGGSGSASKAARMAESSASAGVGTESTVASSGSW